MPRCVEGLGTIYAKYNQYPEVCCGYIRAEQLDITTRNQTNQLDASIVGGYIHGCIHSEWIHPWMRPDWMVISRDASSLDGYDHGCIHTLWLYPWMHPQWMIISMDVSTVDGYI